MENKNKKVTNLFLIDLLNYFIEKIVNTFKNTIYFLTIFTTLSKKVIVQNLFWGRTNMYRNAFQVFILLLTMVIGFSGVTNQFNLVEAKASKSEYLLKNADISNLGITSDIEYNPDLIFGLEEKYIVQAGDNLELIARKIIQNEAIEYELNIEITPERVKRKMEMIRYLNNLLDQNPVLKVGQELSIFFGIDGIVYKTQKGDTIRKISEKFNVGEQDIIDANSNLIEDFLGGDTAQIKLEENSNLFIPTADLSIEITQRINDKKKQQEIAKAKETKKRTSVNYNPNIKASGSFMNPLSSCPGYGYSRGFKSSHKGVDLTKGGGCPIVAADSGFVKTAGYTRGGGGNTVIIEHSNGFITLYAHLAKIYVRPGDSVIKGSQIGYMGSTGNSTGTHLHLSLYYNGSVINPSGVVPY